MGQSVRGLVTERASSAPALGAIVTLERVARTGAPAVEVRSVLVDERGTYTVGTSSPGTFTIVVRRIGLRPFHSDSFALGVGETRRIEIALEAIVPNAEQGFRLQRVTVSGATPCRTANNQAVRVADLWENARTALLATAISARDSLVKRRLIRYERRLEPATLVIQNEQVRVFDAFGGANGGFFRSIPGDSLSKVGYWQRIGTGSARFHGPDENALLSPSFLTDHCFTLVASGARRGAVGLGFEPAEHRRNGDAPPEIRGTIWLDSLTSELRSLEFNWVALPPGAPSTNVGGNVQFARLSWGPWFVERWWLRMPEGLASDRGTPTSRFGILEEGGLVQAGETIANGAALATISGVIRDAAAHPLAKATITIVGTALHAVSDAQGRFAIPDVPPGFQVIEAQHPRYEALGVRAAELDVLLDEGTERELVLTALSDAEIPSRLCGESAQGGLGVLRLIIVDNATRQPIPRLRVTLAERNAKLTGTGYIAHQETDEHGSILFCGAPAERLLMVTTSADNYSAALELALPASGMKVRVLQFARR